MTTNEKRIADQRDFWNVKKSGERLLWRFQKSESGTFRAFTPDEKDALALKSVLAWINRQTENNVQSNHLFAKLFIYHLTMNIRYHQTTIFDEIPQKDLYKLLDTPLPLFYQSFYNDLHHNQLNALSKQNSVEKNNEIMKSFATFKEDYPMDFVMENLNTMISESLNRFS